VISAGARVKQAGEAMQGEAVELVARHQLQHQEQPYQRLLGDAIRGDASQFTSDECVELAWAIVDPLLNNAEPVHAYEPGSWGPAEAAGIVTGDETWHNPQPEATTPC
jgi:glucose-6-phosphate 1-dehydrogenase